MAKTRSSAQPGPASVSPGRGTLLTTMSLLVRMPGSRQHEVDNPLATNTASRRNSEQTLTERPCVMVDRSVLCHSGMAKTLSLTAALALAAVTLAPIARANMPFGNYDLQIIGRYDFHTWVWSVTSCTSECVHVDAIARPVAKAFNYHGDAQFADGRYILTVDVPDGLRCGDIYYGPTIPTHDIYTWDATTLAGSLESSFDAGCDGSPAGTYTYPFTLARM